jgi:hypothetical protein
VSVCTDGAEREAEIRRTGETWLPYLNDFELRDGFRGSSTSPEIMSLERHFASAFQYHVVTDCTTVHVLLF